MEHTAPPPTSAAVAVPALAAYPAQIPECRQARGTQHPRLALLLLVCGALRCGARSPPAVADWGRPGGRPWRRRLGCPQGRAPSQPTLSRRCQAVPRKTVGALPGRWAEQARRRCPPAAGALGGSAGAGKARRTPAA